MTDHCKFCEAMESYRRADTILTKHDPDMDHRYSVAIVRRMFFKGRKGCQGSSTDFKTRGCGYELKFCPECGRKLTKDASLTNYDHIRTLEHYELATAILNIGDEPCKVCPRDREERCNDDCDNGIVEWLTAPYNPNDPVWKEK